MRITGAYAVPLAGATAGGTLLDLTGVPNGMLIGAVIGGLLVCRISRNVRVIPYSLEFMQIVIGLSLGMLLKPGAIEISGDAGFALGILVLCLLLQVGTSYFWLHRGAGWHRSEAILASYPGAMAAVLDLLRRTDVGPRVLVVHLLRLVLLTLVAALAIGEAAVQIEPPSGLLPAGVVTASIIMLATLVAGRQLETLGVPAPFLFVAMTLGAIASASGWLDGSHMPTITIDLATIALAVLIAIKIREIDVGAARAALLPAMITLLLMFAWTLALAALASLVLGRSFVVLLLSFLPGAVESVALVAIASGLEVAFIIQMHLARLVIAHLAPVAVGRFGRFIR